MGAAVVAGDVERLVAEGLDDLNLVLGRGAKGVVFEGEGFGGGTAAVALEIGDRVEVFGKSRGAFCARRVGRGVPVE